jgi:hypothetical protein
MLYSKGFLLTTIFSGLIAIMVIGCDPESSVGVPPIKPLVIVQPKGHETYKVGETKRIEWRINDKTQVASVLIELSLNGGRTFPITLGGNSSFPIDSTKYDWPIDASFVSDSCVVKVCEYNTTSISDRTGMFSIHP